MKMYLLALLGMTMALPLMGQEEEATPQQQQRPSGREVHRQRLIQRFDKDGDGKLNEEEKAAMQSFIEERRKNGGERGERRKHRPDREEMLKKYDKDEDGKLSDEERKAMREDMAKQRSENKRGHRRHDRRTEQED